MCVHSGKIAHTLYSLLSNKIMVVSETLICFYIIYEINVCELKLVVVENRPNFYPSKKEESNVTVRTLKGMNVHFSTTVPNDYFYIVYCCLITINRIMICVVSKTMV